MERELYFLQRVELTLANLKIKIFMAMEHLLGQMEINILVNTKTINKTDMGILFGPKVKDM